MTPLSVTSSSLLYVLDELFGQLYLTTPPSSTHVVQSTTSVPTSKSTTTAVTTQQTTQVVINQTSATSGSMIIQIATCSCDTVAVSECFIFCSFVQGLSLQSRIFHSYRDVTIADEGLQMLTYARHSLPLSSDGSLACNTYYDKGHPYKVIFEDLLQLHLLPKVWQWSCHYLFLRLRG